MVKRGMSRKLYSKSQYAMELLMTYGWALILISGVLGALFYFNIFSVADMKPDVCRLSPGLVCEEVVVHPGNFSIRITNTIGEDIDIITGRYVLGLPSGGKKIKLVNRQTGDICESSLGLHPGNKFVVNIPNGASKIINITSCGMAWEGFTSGHKQEFNLNFEYEIMGVIFDVQGKIFTYVAK